MCAGVSNNHDLLRQMDVLLCADRKLEFTFKIVGERALSCSIITRPWWRLTAGQTVAPAESCCEAPLGAIPECGFPRSTWYGLDIRPPDDQELRQGIKGRKHSSKQSASA